MGSRTATIILLLYSSLAQGQADSVALRYAATITQAELQHHLEIIAADDYEGRDTGREGQKKAAAYLRDQFISYGIQPVPAPDTMSIVEGYYQRFQLIEERSGSIALEAGGTTLTFMNELIYFNEFMDKDLAVEQVLFLGDGRDMTAIQNGDVAIVVDEGVDGMIPFMGRVQAMAGAARDKGASVLLIASPRVAELSEEMGHFITGSRMRLADQEPRAPRAGMQTIIIDREASSALFSGRRPVRIDRLKRGRKVPAAFTLRHTPQSMDVISENVLAFIEGSDKRDEIVILTAHYDHIGVEDGEIYNGADDDGSGTVALLEIAQAFALARRNGDGPRRSVLVMPVTAEEKGLLGSRYYSDNPVFPLENTVVNLNIDMIGRTDSVHAGGDPYVYVIGSDRLSSDLHAINEQANETYTRLELDYTFNAEDDPNKFYYRSDHYNFARKGVPAIFYFSGVHEDYHQPTDTVDKIEFDRLHHRTLLVFHTAWILANREERIRVDKPVR